MGRLRAIRSQARGWRALDTTVLQFASSPSRSNSSSFFPLAAIALFTGRLALLASRLLVAMLVGFALLVWLPAPFADPHKLISWAGNAQNLAITGAAWIVMDYLSRNRAAAGYGKN